MKPFAGSWLRAASLAMAVGLSAGSAAGADGISRDADEVLRAMSKFLGGLKSFSVSTDIGNEIITSSGEKLQLNSHSTLLIERPSRFQVSRKGGFADVMMNYDGARLSIYGKTVNAYLQKDLTGTIDNAIREIERGTGLVMPGADLLLANPYQALASGVVSSSYHGVAYIGDIEAHHLAFRTPEVDFQIWVKTGDEPLPLKYVITTKWLTGAPQYSVQLYNWNLKPAVTANQFRFVPPSGAARLESVSVDQTGEIVFKREGK